MSNSRPIRNNLSRSRLKPKNYKEAEQLYQQNLQLKKQLNLLSAQKDKQLTKFRSNVSKIRIDKNKNSPYLTKVDNYFPQKNERYQNQHHYNKGIRNFDELDYPKDLDKNEHIKSIQSKNQKLNTPPQNYSKFINSPSNMDSNLSSYKYLIDRLQKLEEQNHQLHMQLQLYEENKGDNLPDRKTLNIDFSLEQTRKFQLNKLKYEYQRERGEKERQTEQQNKNLKDENQYLKNRLNQLEKEKPNFEEKNNTRNNELKIKQLEGVIDGLKTMHSSENEKYILKIVQLENLLANEKQENKLLDDKIKKIREEMQKKQVEFSDLEEEMKKQKKLVDKIKKQQQQKIQQIAEANEQAQKLRENLSRYKKQGQKMKKQKQQKIRQLEETVESRQYEIKKIMGQFNKLMKERENENGSMILQQRQEQIERLKLQIMKIKREKESENKGDGSNINKEQWGSQFQQIKNKLQKTEKELQKQIKQKKQYEQKLKLNQYIIKDKQEQIGKLKKSVELLKTQIKQVKQKQQENKKNFLLSSNNQQPSPQIKVKEIQFQDIQPQGIKFQDIKLLLKYRIQSFEYSNKNLSRDFNIYGDELKIQQIQKILAIQPFLLNKQMIKIVIDELFPSSQGPLEKSTVINQLANKLMNKDEGDTRVCRKNSSLLEQQCSITRGQFAAKLKHTLEQLDLSSLFTVSRQNLTTILTKMSFSQEFVNAAIIDMSAYSKDLDHLQFLYFLMVSGQQCLTSDDQLDGQSVEENNQNINIQTKDELENRAQNEQGENNDGEEGQNNEKQQNDQQEKGYKEKIQEGEEKEEKEKEKEGQNKVQEGQEKEDEEGEKEDQEEERDVDILKDIQ